jgi:membrane protein DedA with SNARE-associated domain
MEEFFHRLMEFTATPDAWTLVLLLLWCAMGEVAVAIPYVLESFWLMAGFNVGAGNLAWWYLILLWMAAQAGRQAGSFTLYRIARLGVPALEKFFRKIHLDKWFDKITSRTKSVKKMNLASPFTVASGRMIGLRVPMMLVMAGMKRPWSLALGVMLSSLIWDSLYIATGAIFGSTVKIEPGYLLLISFGMMAFIWTVTFIVKKVIKRFRKPASETIEG